MIYLDNAATTFLNDVVKSGINAFLEDETDFNMNPSAAYAQFTKDRIRSAREFLASQINAEPDEIFFTSGATESINWLMQCVIDPYKALATTIDHKAVIKNADKLIKVNSDGTFDPDDLTGYNESYWFCYSHINNEIGTINDTNVKKYFKGKVFLDATQSFGKIPIDVKKMKIDALCCSAHKFHGLKGIGMLYVNKETELFPLIEGGSQERGMRGGTENILGIISMHLAAVENCNDRKYKNKKTREIQRYFHESIINNIPIAKLNGAQELRRRYFGNLNYCFEGIGAAGLLEFLRMNYIYASSGSACNTDNGKPSHVLKGIGLTDAEANSSIRFTFDETLTFKEVDKTVHVLKEGINLLS